MGLPTGPSSFTPAADASSTPGIFASLGQGLQIGGVLTQAFGAYQQSQAQQQAYAYQAAVAANNAAAAEIAAQDALRRGQKEEQNVRLKTAALRGSQRASLAARGIDLGEGSALDILTTTDFMGERDALTTRDNAEKEAWGHRVRGAGLAADAGLLSNAASNINPFASAAGTLLTGASGVASSWAKWKN